MDLDVKIGGSRFFLWPCFLFILLLVSLYTTAIGSSTICLCFLSRYSAGILWLMEISISHLYLPWLLYYVTVSRELNPGGITAPTYPAPRYLVLQPAFIHALP